MNKLLFVLAMLLALPVLASAQELPRTEIFGGYSYMRLDQDGQTDQDLNGFNTSFTYNFNSFLGATAEFSAFFGTTQMATTTGMLTTVDQDNYFYLFGPKFTFRGNERFTPFAHVLLGAVTQDVGQVAGSTMSTANNTQFAMALGGGLDVSVTERISLRAIQADYVLTRLVANTNQNNIRASAGFVLKLGEQ
jgi:opacity protein-like surface antigen